LPNVNTNEAAKRNNKTVNPFDAVWRKLRSVIWDCYWNEWKVNSSKETRNNWRASLVPAAAVIPAPIAYIKVVAVKKLVVGLYVSFQLLFICFLVRSLILIGVIQLESTGVQNK